VKLFSAINSDVLMGVEASGDILRDLDGRIYQVSPEKLIFGKLIFQLRLARTR
jgi:hypothetical protein